MSPARTPNPETKPKATRPRKGGPVRKLTDLPVALQEMVPPSWFADDYVDREFSGGRTGFQILDSAHKTRLNVLCSGPTGVAKTSMVYAYGAKREWPVWSVPCNSASEPSEIFGDWAPTDTPGLLTVDDGPGLLLMKHGGILILDEVNMMRPSIAAAMHSILDKRRTYYNRQAKEVVKAHRDFMVVATYNPGYADTYPLNEAFRNRFAHKLVFDYDPELEKDGLELPHHLVHFAMEIRQRYLQGDISSPVTTNMLLDMVTFAQDPDLGIDYAIGNFLSAFEDPTERSGVKTALEVKIDNIKAELEGYDLVDDEEDEYEVDQDEDEDEDEDVPAPTL